MLPTQRWPTWSARGTPGVVLGPNTTTLVHLPAQALSATWRPGDEIVLSRLDTIADLHR